MGLICRPPRDADDPRTERVLRRIRDIQSAACQLVLQHGYDGFTMDDLAEAAGVSRRTLFNYVPDKASAVLGRNDFEDHPQVDAFRAGGPTGVLMPDLIDALDSVMNEFTDTEAAAELHELVERTIANDAKVAHLALERFAHLSELLADLICEREKWERGDLRARTISATFIALVKVSVEEFSRREAATDFMSVFHEVLDADAAVRAMR